MVKQQTFISYFWILKSLYISFGGCDPDHKSESGLLNVFIHFRTHPSGLKGAAFTCYLLFWWLEDQVGTCCTSWRVWLGLKGILRKDFPGSKGKKKERKEKKNPKNLHIWRGIFLHSDRSGGRCIRHCHCGSGFRISKWIRSSCNGDRKCGDMARYRLAIQWYRERRNRDGGAVFGRRFGR